MKLIVFMLLNKKTGSQRITLLLLEAKKMYKMKRQFLDRGFAERIEEISRETCCVSTGIDPLLAESEQSLIVYLESDALNSVMTLNFNYLIGKWLKVKKYIDLPPDQDLVALLFLQPIWMNYFFEVTVRRVWRSKVFPQEVLSTLADPKPFCSVRKFHPPPFSGTGILGVCDQYISDTQRHTVYVDHRFPFVVVEFIVDSQEIIDLYAIDIQQPCSQRRSEIVPTLNSKIWIILMSQVLQDEDDCAKLLRQFLKHPHNPIWTNSAVGLGSSLRTKITINSGHDYILYNFFLDDLNQILPPIEEIVNDDIQSLRTLSPFDIVSDFALNTCIDGLKWNE